MRTVPQRRTSSDCVEHHLACDRYVLSNQRRLCPLLDRATYGRRNAEELFGSPLQFSADLHVAKVTPASSSFVSHMMLHVTHYVYRIHGNVRIHKRCNDVAILKHASRSALRFRAGARYLR